MFPVPPQVRRKRTPVPVPLAAPAATAPPTPDQQPPTPDKQPPTPDKQTHRWPRTVTSGAPGQRCAMTGPAAVARAP